MDEWKYDENVNLVKKQLTDFRNGNIMNFGKVKKDKESKYNMFRLYTDIRKTESFIGDNLSKICSSVSALSSKSKNSSTSENSIKSETLTDSSKLKKLAKTIQKKRKPNESLLIKGSKNFYKTIELKTSLELRELVKKKHNKYNNMETIEKDEDAKKVFESLQTPVEYNMSEKMCSQKPLEINFPEIGQKIYNIKKLEENNSTFSLPIKSESLENRENDAKNDAKESKKQDKWVCTEYNKQCEKSSIRKHEHKELENGKGKEQNGRGEREMYSGFKEKIEMLKGGIQNVQKEKLDKDFLNKSLYTGTSEHRDNKNENKEKESKKEKKKEKKEYDDKKEVEKENEDENGNENGNSAGGSSDENDSDEISEQEFESDSNEDEAIQLECIRNGCRSVKNYKKLNKISAGTYGTVYRAMNKKTHKIVALKQLKNFSNMQKEGFAITSLREIHILLQLKHENILSIKEVVVGKHLNDIYLVMTYIEHELKILLDNKIPNFTVAELKCLLKQLLNGLNYLHKNWVIHRDLKTTNLLYNNKGVLKICDFGMSRKFSMPVDNNMTMNVVTLWYRAPELLLGEKQYTNKIDIWSTGCIFGELFLRKPLFTGENEFKQMICILNVLGLPDEKKYPKFYEYSFISKNKKFFKEHGEAFKTNKIRSVFPSIASQFSGSDVYLTEKGFDLIQAMLKLNPEERISAEEALNHPYFQEIPKPTELIDMPRIPDTNKIARTKNLEQRFMMMNSRNIRFHF